MEQPIASVIMAAFNSELYIKEAIDSILNQTLQDFELIVTDDCSTDSTAAILASYQDDRIRILHNEKNQGAPYSRNYAIRSAKGKYLAILDADDISMPNRLREQVDYLEENQDISGTGSYVWEINSSGQKTRTVQHPIKAEQVKCSMFFRCSIVHSAAMIRRDFFINNQLFYDETFPCSQDYEMWSRAIFAGRISNLPQFLTLYRCSETQMSVTRKEIQFKQAERVYYSLLQRLGIEVTEKEMGLHSLFITQKSLGSKKDISEIVHWAEFLFKKNKEAKVFVENDFTNEILLRYLRFCRVNKVGLCKTVCQLLKLQFRILKVYFPFHLLLQRLSKTYKNI
jgi:glycosyltransferase involved in cell wall biosynthesis